MSKAFQEFDQNQSRKKTPQNRKQVPGPLMSKTRCKVCGDAIEGMTGGLLVGVINGEVGATVYAYHDLTYGQRHERENYTDISSLVTYKRLDACSDGITMHVSGLLQTALVVDAWCVEGDFRAALEFIERKVPVRLTDVDEVLSQHRERLEVLEAAATLQRKRTELTARFMGIPHKMVVNIHHSGQTKMVQLLVEAGNRKSSLFRRRNGQQFISLECLLPVNCGKPITRWVLHSIPEKLGIGLRRHGSPYGKVMRVIYSIPGDYNMNQVAAALNKLLSGNVLTELQWDTLMRQCQALPTGCSSKDVNDFLKVAIKPIVTSVHPRRV